MLSKEIFSLAGPEELCAGIVADDEAMSSFLDDHWNKLRLLVAMLHQDGAEPRTIGSLLSDVAERFIETVEGFEMSPISFKATALAEMTGMTTSAADGEVRS